MGSPMAWPPLSPVPTPMDFVLCGQEEQVYAISPRSREDLVARLQAVVTVDASM